MENKEKLEVHHNTFLEWIAYIYTENKFETGLFIMGLAGLIGGVVTRNALMAGAAGMIFGMKLVQIPSDHIIKDQQDLLQMASKTFREFREELEKIERKQGEVKKNANTKN